MNIAIVGPGAVGLLLAGYLQKTMAQVTLVDHLPERAALLNREGIRWEGMDADLNYRVPVTVGLTDPAGTDLAILCVKAYHTEIAARGLADAGYSGTVMTLQNGVGNVEAIRRALPGAVILAGTTSEGANLRGVNHVRHAGKGKTAFGLMENDRDRGGFIDALASLMRDAGMDTDVSNDPLSLIWGKVLVNAGINALTALLSVQNGRLLDIEPARALMADLVREGWEVVKSKGLNPPYRDPVARVEEVCRLTAENYSSMYMDMKEGRMTEIGFINGAIVREGASLGLPCPCNGAVTAIIRGMEQVKGIAVL